MLDVRRAAGVQPADASPSPPSVATSGAIVGRGPRTALLAAAGLTAITLLVCGAVLLRSSASVAALEGPAAAPTARPKASDAPAAASATAAPEPAGSATPADLEAARTKGLPALTELADRHPTDPAVLKALLLAHARGKDTSIAAVSVVRRLLEVAPAEASDTDVRQVVLRAANGPPEVAAAAFDLMSRSLGSVGPDLLYDLLTAEKVGKLPHERAEKLLLDPEVRKLATPALLVAHELRRTIGQCASKPVIARARQSGDARSLHYLRQLLGTYRCGPLNLGTCKRCPAMVNDAGAAIRAIEARRNTP